MEEKNRLYDQFDTKKIENFTADNLDSFRDQVFIEQSNDELIKDLIRTGIIANQLSLSGPIPRTLKLLNFNYTTTGNNKETLGISDGEVWQLNTLSIAEQGSGTGTVTFLLEDKVSGDASVIAVGSTTSQEPVAVANEGVGSPIYITSDFYFNNLVNSAGGTSVEVDITLIRVR